MPQLYLVLFASSILAAFGQLCLKLGADRGGLAILTASKFWLGLFLYACSTLLWVYALSKVELNLAYAFTALTFLLVYTMSFALLGEQVTGMRLLGLGLILCGFLVLFRFG